MKYAKQISEMINAFTPEPLKQEQMEQFYCKDAMECRTSDKYSSPIEDIFDSCRESESQTAFLLLGHKGCGKSTELNLLSEKLIAEGYPVKNIPCSTDLDMRNIVYSDLLVLMGEALIKISDELDCDIDEDTLNKILNFWVHKIETATSAEEQAASLETEFSAGTPGVLAVVLKVLAKVKADLKYSEEKRTEYRKEISNRSSEWIKLLSCVSEKISLKTDGKPPIIMFEELDRLDSDVAWEVFYNYSAILSGMSFPVIYTFPIGLSYDGKFAAVESYFIPKTLPMIKIETKEGESYEEGIEVIREIVRKRANLELFEPNTLDKLIRYTGGSLRDLFAAINTSARRAMRRQSTSISMEDVDRALEELKTSLTRRIEKKDYAFLAEIYNGKREQIEDRKKLLEMLQALVVLEYNGTRWHNVHPLVVEFLKDQGVIE